MYWVLGIVLLVGFFYLVGLHDARKKEAAKLARIANLKPRGKPGSRESKKAKAARAYLRSTENVQQRDYKYRKSPEADVLGLDMSTYNAWVSTLLGRLTNLYEFELFGTPAAILWSPNSDVVEVVSVTAFAKGEPSTKTFDHYSYNVREGYWEAAGPRGAANECKAEIRDMMARTQGEVSPRE